MWKGELVAIFIRPQESESLPGFLRYMQFLEWG
jgi:hypothetical protein